MQVSTSPADRVSRWLLLLCVLLTVLPAQAGPAEPAGDTRSWRPLSNDDVHDPTGPAIKQLQEPRDGLAPLPPDTAGNKVRWLEALDKGVIAPRSNIFPETKVELLDLDILLDLYGNMPMVLFPHLRHTKWLDCSNCHDHIFKKKTGTSGISMLRILNGEQCGLCHGAVAFPLTECFRCHSVPRKTTNVRSGAYVDAPPEQKK